MPVLPSLRLVGTTRVRLTLAPLTGETNCRLPPPASDSADFCDLRVDSDDAISPLSA